MSGPWSDSINGKIEYNNTNNKDNINANKNNNS